MPRMFIEVAGHTLEAELSDSPAAKAVWSALPLSAQMSRWGEEYYGSVGLEIPQDGTGRELMAVGEVAYWPPGKALCIFFGPTPASEDDRPRAASAVLPVGRVTRGLGELSRLADRVMMKFRADA